MSGSGNATVKVTGEVLWLRNRYLTVTISGVTVSSSDSIAMSGERVNTSPPTESSAELSLASDGAGAQARQPAAVVARINARHVSVVMFTLSIADRENTSAVSQSD